MLDSTATSIEDEHSAKIPTQFALHQNYPNPFNPNTIIKYDLPKTANVKLVLYNMIGQRVRTLVDKEQVAGFHAVEWDGRNDSGVPLATGVYLYRLEADEFVQVKKLLLLK